MANEAIGAAYLDIIVRTEDLDVAVAKSKNQMHGLGEAAERAYQVSDAAAKRAATNLDRWANGIGKTKEETQLLNAAMRGVPVDILDAVAKKVTEAQRNMHAAADAQRELNRVMEEALSIDQARDAQRAQNAQRQFSVDYGAEAPDRSNDYLEEQARVIRALTLQAELREQAEREVAAAMAVSHEEALAINRAFDEQIAKNAQRQFNVDYGVEPAQRSIEYLEEQQRVVAALISQADAREQAEKDVAQALQRQSLALESQAYDDNNFLNQLRQTSQEAGKTRSELLELRAAQRGLTNEAAPYIARLREQENALYGTTTKLNDYGLSQKQVAAAMRGVPAQITDIFVSLQGGQAPLTVLLQQGGQLKDMFGGIVPAAKALSSQLVALINPYTILGGIALTFTAAMYSQTKQMDDYVVQLAKTGSQARFTAEDLQQAAERISEAPGVTAGMARDAATEMLRLRTLTDEQMEAAATAAARWASASGDEIDKVVDKYKEIQKDPLKALLDLADAEGWVTQAQHDRVRELIEANNQTQAAAEVTDWYTANLNKNADFIDARLSNISKLWKDIKDAASEAWDFIGEAADAIIGRARNSALATGALVGNLWNIGNSEDNNPIARFRAIAGAGEEYGRVMVGVFKGIDTTAKDAAEAMTNVPMLDPARQKELNEQRKNDQRLIEQGERQSLSRADAHKEKMDELAEAYKRVGKEDEGRLVIARANAKFAEEESKRNRPKAGATDPTVALLRQVRTQIEVNERGAESEEKLTASQRLAIRVREALTDAGGRASAAGRREIAVLLEKLDATDKTATAEAKRKEAAEDLLKLQEQLALNETNRLARNELDLEAINGLSEVQQAAARRRLDIEKEFEGEVAKLRKQGMAETDESYVQQMRTLQDHRNRQLTIEEDYQKRVIELQSSAAAGMRGAFNDYMDSARDTAGKMRDTMRNAFEGAEENIVKFVTTGKTSFSDLVNSMVADLARLATNKMMVQLIGGITGGGGTTGSLADLFGGAWGFANGGAFPSGTLSQYSNQVHDTPKFFAFAKGGAGVFGEAGPEAIMPLQRDSSGRLGVKALAGSGAAGGVPNVIVNAYGVESQPEVQVAQTDNGLEIELMFNGFEKRMAGNVSAGRGPMGSAIKNRFGLKDN
jgi:lambda family phage tail tape measure protein